MSESKNREERNDVLPPDHDRVYDPEWQKAHMEMGFYSPIGELYKALGLIDDKEDDDEYEEGGEEYEEEGAE